MNILVINAGSSSLKYQLMDPDTGVVTAKGLCERIGLDGRLNHKVIATGKKLEKDIPMPTHKEAIESVMDILVDAEYGVIKSVDEIDAVGHRVLHGGDKFVESCIVTEACKELADVAETYLVTQLERGFYTLDFYKSLLLT